MNFTEAVECYRCLLCKALLDELDQVHAAYVAWTHTSGIKELNELCLRCVYGRHQYHMSSKAKAAAVRKLSKELPTILSSHYADFEELYDVVVDLLRETKYFKDAVLTFYDCALRIGHIHPQHIYPIKNVYLCYSGAMTGAKKLLSGRPLNPIEDFNTFFSYKEARAVQGITALQALPSCLVEDFLCVMHQYLDCGPRGLIADRHTTDTYQQLEKFSEATVIPIKNVKP